LAYNPSQTDGADGRIATAPIGAVSGDARSPGPRLLEDSTAMMITPALPSSRPYCRVSSRKQRGDAPALQSPRCWLTTCTALVLALASTSLSAAAEDGGASESGQTGEETIERLYHEAEQQRRELADANARLQERLQAAQQDADLAARIMEQTRAIDQLSRRLDPDPAAGDDVATVSPPSSTADADPAAATQTGNMIPIAPQQLRAELADTERRLRLLIDQFAVAHRQRREAVDQAAAARLQVAELNALIQQQQLVVQEAQLRAEKAEKLHAALEEAHARVTTENERLTLELGTARERQAEAMQQVVSLDSRLAAAEARVAQLQGEAKTLLERGPASESTPRTSVTEAPPETVPVEGDGNEPIAAEETDVESEAPASTRVVRPAVYMVRSDDTLSRISAKVYGDASVWRRIYEANRDVLATPDELAPGMTLVIP
jgi:nucleoid-associated protein YgaU